MLYIVREYRDKISPFHTLSHRLSIQFFLERGWNLTNFPSAKVKQEQFRTKPGDPPAADDRDTTMIQRLFCGISRSLFREETFKIMIR
jgi:hypothetical protein